MTNYFRVSDTTTASSPVGTTVGNGVQQEKASLSFITKVTKRKNTLKSVKNLKPEGWVF